jgi:membrane associated rhomboid family serine protease
MIPLRDSVRARSFAFVNIILIVINGIVFYYELSLGADLNIFINRYGFIPAKFTSDVLTLSPKIFGSILPLFSSMFLHGGWLHFIGNMWFLWIFGDNVEDSMGHIRYLFFYVLLGIGAGVTHLVFNLNSVLPTIGASGAISGIMGAYLVLHPKGRILTLIPIFIFIRIIELPAYVFLLFWIIFQAFQGMIVMKASQSAGGVAWWAHIGGFILGVILIFLFKKRNSRLFS